MEIIKETNIEDTSFIFLHQTRAKSQIIYTTTLIAVLVVFAILPFLYVTVSVKGTGAVQSNIEKTELLAPVNGKLVFVNLKDNEKVQKGELLLSIDASLPKQQYAALSNRVIELKRLINDALLVLKSADFANSGQPELQSGLYLASWQQFIEQQESALNARNQAQRIFARYETLYDKKAVTSAEYEEYRFNYEQALSDWKMVPKRNKSRWETEIRQYKDELRELEDQTIQVTEQEKLYTVLAPVSGSVQNLNGMQTGTFVYANQKIGEISPDSALLAFSYVKPSDIGLIKIGQEVRFQIDAFNYNQWGLINGNVIDISEDIVVINQIPYFKVKCALSKNYLQLKNGYKGQIRKGMTLSAHFTVTERSLFQLLYDRVDDWLNPGI